RGHGGAQRLILGALSQGAGSRHSHAVGQMRKEGTGAFGAAVTLFTLFTVKYPGQKDAGMRVAHQSSLLKHPAYFTRVGPLSTLCACTTLFRSLLHHRDTEGTEVHGG